MFKNLFNKSSRPKKMSLAEIYEQYHFFLDDKLLPLGFAGKEVAGGIGKDTTYNRGNLNVILQFDYRDQHIWLIARSGKTKIIKTSKTVVDVQSLITGVPKGEATIEEDDIFIGLEYTEKMKTKLVQDLDKWLAEHS
jgi:hypothetical protein